MSRKVTTPSVGEPPATDNVCVGVPSGTTQATHSEHFGLLPSGSLMAAFDRSVVYNQNEVCIGFKAPNLLYILTSEDTRACARHPRR